MHEMVVKYFSKKALGFKEVEIVSIKAHSSEFIF